MAGSELERLRAEISEMARACLAACRERGVMIATAESCTGGLVAAALTDIPGSSAVVERGVVSYSNTAKSELLGVAPALFDAHGAVSPEVARAMAEGLLARSPDSVFATVSITGIAGPGGATPTKPEGRVEFACASRGGETRLVTRDYGPEGRAEVRARSTHQALALLLAAVEG